VTNSLSIVPLSRSTSRTAVSIQRTLRSRGEEIGAIDALIAGTAAESDDPRVLTRNVGNSLALTTSALRRTDPDTPIAYRHWRQKCNDLVRGRQLRQHERRRRDDAA
jgi:hypothetical protein